LGAYHGAWLSVERLVRGGRPAGQDSTCGILSSAGTFLIVTLGWVFFRAKDLPESLYIIGQMFGAAHGKILFLRWHVGLAVVALIVALADEKFDWFERIMIAPGWAYGAAISLMLFCLELFGVFDEAIPFIYFQF